MEHNFHIYKEKYVVEIRRIVIGKSYNETQSVKQRMVYKIVPWDS